MFRNILRAAIFLMVSSSAFSDGPKPSCEAVVKRVQKNSDSLEIGLTKSLAIEKLGIEECENPDGSIVSPVEFMAMPAGPDSVEVLIFKFGILKSGVASMKPLYFKNGKYVGSRVGFVTGKSEAGQP